MVEWTEQERTIITGIFANLDYEDIGAKALCRYGNGSPQDAASTPPLVAPRQLTRLFSFLLL